MAGKRPTNIELEKRLDQVYEMAVTGANARQIWRYVTQKLDWHVGLRTIERYMGIVEERFRQASAPFREVELGRAIARLHKLFFLCMQIQDYRTALAVQRELNLMLGLYATPQSATHGNDTAAAEVRKLIREYADRAMDERD